MSFVLHMIFPSSFCSFPFFIFPVKAKGQSAKVNINTALVEDIISLDEVKEDMTGVLNALKDDFTRNLSIRTSPGIQLVSVARKARIHSRSSNLHFKSPFSYFYNADMSNTISESQRHRWCSGLI